MRTVPATVPINLPQPSGRYADDFGHGVSIGASSSSRVDGVWVWLHRHEMSPDEARETAAALLAAAYHAEAENDAGA